MSNSNYIQNVENVQQVSKKYYSYLYELRHIPTGLLYVGSRSNQSVLKKFEDCYTDDYLGSSSLEEGPFSNTDTKKNPQDYAKTVLKVFYDEDPKKATKYEHGSNGLIMTYWNLYGKDKVLNQHCILNNGSKIFSNAGQNPFVNKTETEMIEIKQKQSDSNKKVHQNRTEEQKAEIKQKRNDTLANKTEEEKAKTSQKLSEANKGKNKGKNPLINKTKEEKEEIKQKKSNALKDRKGINTYANKTENEMAIIKQKLSEVNKGENNPMFGKNPFVNKTEAEMRAISQKQSDSHKGEKNGSCTQYRHPYNSDFIGNGKKVSTDIKKNYPNEKQWSDFTKEEKKSYLVVSQNDAGCIQNQN